MTLEEARARIGEPVACSADPIPETGVILGADTRRVLVRHHGDGGERFHDPAGLELLAGKAGGADRDG